MTKISGWLGATNCFIVGFCFPLRFRFSFGSEPLPSDLLWWCSSVLEQSLEIRVSWLQSHPGQSLFSELSRA